jgi:hypothetical protein
MYVLQKVGDCVCICELERIEEEAVMAYFILGFDQQRLK